MPVTPATPTSVCWFFFAPHLGVWDPGVGPMIPKFELGWDFCAVHLTAKFHCPTFNRSEVTAMLRRWVIKARHFNPFRPEFASKLKYISTTTKMSRNQVYLTQWPSVLMIKIHLALHLHAGRSNPVRSVGHKFTYQRIKAKPVQVVKVIWHRATLLPQINGSIVFARWRQRTSHEGTLAPPGEYDWTCASCGPAESTTQTTNRLVQPFLHSSRMYN